MSRKFKYTGDPASQEQSAIASAFGYDFELNGKAVAVDDDIAEKFAGNNHFTEVKAKKKKAAKKK